MIWPAVAEDIQSWALLLSFVGALFVLGLWPGVVYARSSQSA
jgi:hypothetical protein